MSTKVPTVVYFSNMSENTHRFVQKLELNNIRIPMMTRDAAQFAVDEEFVLIVPTYGDKNLTNHVPRQVKKFLALQSNRENMKAVIAAGNMNFGRQYGIAGNLISAKCQVPFLYCFELMGTPEDVNEVRKRLEQLNANN